MTKSLLLFGYSFVLGLVYLFVGGGNSLINYQNVEIHVNLYAVIIAALLCSNLLVLLILIFRRNK